MKRAEKRILRLFVLWEVVFFLLGLLIGYWVAQKPKTQTRADLFNEAMEYDAEMANWIAEMVYLKEMSQKEGDEALKHLVELYRIIER